MLEAKKRITLVGWDFDARIGFGRDVSDGGPSKLGDFILWLVERSPELEVFLLRWDVGATATLFRGTTILRLISWMRHPRIHTKLDSAHPSASSHHQKIVMIDDCFAFCGGIDMTGDRWDTRQHLYQDERRRRPTTHRRYKPWHDATSAFSGPITTALAEVCRQRWDAAGGTPEMWPINDVEATWPEGLWTQFRNVPMAISRSAPEYGGRPAVCEIEQLYVDQIARAERFIYAESQYFASRRISEAMAARLEEPDGPEIVIINPMTAEGWLEPVAMNTARGRFVEALQRKDRHGRFRMYHPYNDGGEAIYVHAKVMVVDDQVLRIGSANMNNRSMRLDTECDVTIDAALVGDRDLPRTIAKIRDDFLAEHLDCDAATVSEAIIRSGSVIEAIDGLRGAGRTLRPFRMPDITDGEAWLADNEVLDPEGPGEMFEPIRKRGLFRRWRGGRS
ncbi:phospholipase D-like domain-containing protein [Aurantimonas sp. A2-1-M11]|uniref:phospholipase D-like domain-containing protein n=1 Tax=Aurantimonas sp. A2-1-M11 TaxID=3113712 RepID=UPI002F948F9F